ncbi:MAG: hypothetical protein D3922_04145 [Candidatus Electrothrix sp. AR1]|nr:hypothetical protein [Candidatus Electrothrix sp. AR1]
MTDRNQGTGERRAPHTARLTEEQSRIVDTKKPPKKKDDGASALVDRAVNPGPRILPQAMNKLQGERAVVNKKYDISLSPVIKSRETLKETPEIRWQVSPCTSFPLPQNGP